ncbi:unnamed protein product [Hymenolepis diminuta]|uniref:TPR_REGION domain-containing protein n=1 Tax=Hymenolepis diminuta TaxID=6216 RepID=A0A0R3SG37_HYMDI|nr:unnamed protein product [Hymenolepis diminuta]
MSSETKRKLCQSIAAFLKNECSSGLHSVDVTESLEVARQCIESAFDVSGDSKSEVDLLALVGKQITSRPTVRQVTPEEKAKAESLKTQGNSFVSAEKFQEALECYNKAVALDPYNAIYYCNRAAANHRLLKYSEAISDCEKALEIDSSYSKAYSRMGLANTFCSMGNYSKSVEAYRKAVALDPNNENFKQNLEIAETKLKESQQSSIGASSGPNFVGLDLGSLLSNPVMRNMAQRLMTDPQMQTTVTSMMQNLLGGGSAPAAPNANSEQSNTDSTAPVMDDLLRYGQQFAQQMQQTNPDLVNTLRQQMQNLSGGQQQQPNGSEPRPPNS